MATSLELFPVIISLRVDGLEPPVFMSASWTQWKRETLGYTVQRVPAGERFYTFWKHTFVQPGEHLFIFSKEQNWFVDRSGELKKDEFGRTCNVVRVCAPHKRTPSEAGMPDGDEVVDNTNNTCGWVDTDVPLSVKSLSGQAPAARDGDEITKPLSRNVSTQDVEGSQAPGDRIVIKLPPQMPVMDNLHQQRLPGAVPDSNIHRHDHSPNSQAYPGNVDSDHEGTERCLVR